MSLIQLKANWTVELMCPKNELEKEEQEYGWRLDTKQKHHSHIMLEAGCDVYITDRKARNSV